MKFNPSILLEYNLVHKCKVRDERLKVKNESYSLGTFYLFFI